MKKIIKISLILGTTICFSGQAADAVKGNAEAGKGKITACAACHGPDGTGMNPDWPRLAGQGEKYLFKQLTQFKSGERKDAVMAPQVAALSEQDLADIAAYFSSVAPKYDVAGAAGSEEVTEALLARGEALYRGGSLEAGITACAACHGPAGRGIAPSAYPAISGQFGKYIAKQLKDFRLGSKIHVQASDVNTDTLAYRDNDPGKMMRATTGKLTDKDIEALANYIQGLQP